MKSRAERVAAGAVWLDEENPQWFERINLDTLDVEDVRNCVAGQLYDGFRNLPVPGVNLKEAGEQSWLGEISHAQWLAIHRRFEGWTRAHGFNEPRHMWEHGRAKLNELWTAEILKRRAAA